MPYMDTSISHPPKWVYQEHCNCKRCFEHRRKVKDEKERDRNRATVVGEFVGKYSDQDDSTLVLTDPRMIVNAPKGWDSLAESAKRATKTPMR